MPVTTDLVFSELELSLLEDVEFVEVSLEEELVDVLIELDELLLFELELISSEQPHNKNALSATRENILYFINFCPTKRLYAY